MLGASVRRIEELPKYPGDDEDDHGNGIDQEKVDRWAVHRLLQVTQDGERNHSLGTFLIQFRLVVPLGNPQALQHGGPAE